MYNFAQIVKHQQFFECNLVYTGYRQTFIDLGGKTLEIWRFLSKKLPEYAVISRRDDVLSFTTIFQKPESSYSGLGDMQFRLFSMPLELEFETINKVIWTAYK